MAKLKHIVEGWGKSIGLLSINKTTKALSLSRLSKCAECPFAVESSFLKIVLGRVENMSAIKCTECGCPVNEKTLVTTEKCPKGKW